MHPNDNQESNLLATRAVSTGARIMLVDVTQAASGAGAQGFRYLGSMTLKNTGSVRAVDMACARMSSCSKDDAATSSERGGTLFSLLLRLVNDTESYSFMMSSSTFEMKTVTVRPSR